MCQMHLGIPKRDVWESHGTSRAIAALPHGVGGALTRIGRVERFNSWGCLHYLCNCSPFRLASLSLSRCSNACGLDVKVAVAVVDIILNQQYV